MKKAEEIAVENHLFKSVDVIYDNFALLITRDCYVQVSRNIIKAIKEAQENAIRETVEECAENAEIEERNYLRTSEPKRTNLGQEISTEYDGIYYGIDKNSILSIADKLIKEL